jgi:hypothetical protein
MSAPLCKNCGEDEALWLDTLKGDILADGSVSDGTGEYMPVCYDCYESFDGDDGAREILLAWSELSGERGAWREDTK